MILAVCYSSASLSFEVLLFFYIAIVGFVRLNKIKSIIEEETKTFPKQQNM